MYCCWAWQVGLSVCASVPSVYQNGLIYFKQVYWRWYESHCSSKPKLHFFKYSEKRFSIWRMEFLRSWHWFPIWLHPSMWHVALVSWQWIHQVAAPCNVICVSGMTCHWSRPVAASCSVTHTSGIMTLNSPGGSTLQCGRWFLDDMPLNSPKRLPYWNSTSGFDLDHITAVDMSFCTSLQNFIQIGPHLTEKMTLSRF